jgi:hypothetical protein
MALEELIGQVISEAADNTSEGLATLLETNGYYRQRPLA